MMSLSFEYKACDSIDEAIAADLEVFRRIKAGCLVSMESDGIRYVVDVLNLEPFLEIMASFNTANRLAGVGFHHAARVMLNCYEGAYHEGLEGDELRGLVAGALFHDFNHSGSGVEEAVNLERGLSGLMTAQVFAVSQQLGLNAVGLKAACATIAITKKAYQPQPLSLAERIMCDAHAMQGRAESEKAVGLAVGVDASSGDPERRYPSATAWQTQWGWAKAGSLSEILCLRHNMS